MIHRSAVMLYRWPRGSALGSMHSTSCLINLFMAIGRRPICSCRQIIPHGSSPSSIGSSLLSAQPSLTSLKLPQELILCHRVSGDGGSAHDLVVTGLPPEPV
jgi:hypothetical protein